jgi:hypothetical protein
LNLEDELNIQMQKLIWKWDKTKTPPGLKISSKKNNRLRRKRFEKYRFADSKSINYRIAEMADKNITEISQVRSKKVLIKSLRHKLFSTKYSTSCTRRNCFICSSQQ